MQQRLWKIVACSLGCCLAVGIPLAIRLAWTYEVEGYHGLRANPLAFWLPLAVTTAMTSYFTALTILGPLRFFVGASTLWFGLAALLTVVRLVFHDAGRELSEVLTPWIVHVVSFALVLTLIRMRYRLSNDAAGLQDSKLTEWQFPLSDLLLLATGVACLFAVVRQFDYIWYTGEAQYYRFLQVFGLCISAASLSAVFATLGNSWHRWVLTTLILVPLCLAPARDLQISLIFPLRWLTLFVAIDVAVLAILLLPLRFANYRLTKVSPASPTPRASERGS